MALIPIKGVELEDFHGDSSITTSRAPDAIITHFCHLTYLERHELRDLLIAWLEVSHNTTDLLSLCPITQSQRESFFSNGMTEVGVCSQDLPVSREERKRALENGEQEPIHQHTTARQAGQKVFMIPSMYKDGKKIVIVFLYMDADDEFGDPEHVTFKPPGSTREDAYMRSIKDYDKSQASRVHKYNLEAIIHTARKRIVKYANDGVMEGRLPAYTGHRVPTRFGTDPILPKIESGDACWET
ncbi:hypothetical protein FOXYS1_14556 [Fusarium oxysporum]|uniref:Uncharacterized protein n=4 Tax=Fusarium oxysporum TaxID=5507 RepID=A0A8H4ZVW1_FUSOX|nr:hypothetical protein FOXYS1_14556 [Fusarium oxysporum]